MTAARAVALSLPLLFALACGGGSGGGGARSGLESSKLLVTLSDGEKGQLCDWMVAKAGSYGTPGSCDRTQPAASYPFLAYDDQAACVADAADQTTTPDCQATVGQLEACVNMLSTCATLTAAGAIPACAVLSDC
jgi:hypothetical protein